MITTQSESKTQSNPDYKTEILTSEFQYHGNLLGFVQKASLRARMSMLKKLISYHKPTQRTRILDIGVTADSRIDSNFFEQYYPHPENITAVGLEDASFLEERYPGLRFVQADALDLPFPDKSFDLVTSFAVLEHVGNRERQRRFVEEACRVGKAVFITTPNRFYPIEFHTVLPFVHWLPAPMFRAIIKAIGYEFFAQEENLNLLTEKEAVDLVPKSIAVTTLNQKFFGFVSNIILCFNTESYRSDESDRQSLIRRRLNELVEREI